MKIAILSVCQHLGMAKAMGALRPDLKSTSAMSARAKC